MTKTSPKTATNPLDRLQQMATAEANRRASAREANRARFPWLAEMTDMLGPDCKLVWAQDAQGEIGKRPPLEPELFEISSETFDGLRMHATYCGGKRR